MSFIAPAAYVRSFRNILCQESCVIEIESASNLKGSVHLLWILSSIATESAILLDLGNEPRICWITETTAVPQ
jgi:hypothetical protein